eukprot:TRINITY_DN6589_c0_g1_i1.p1 TRINITY_DN6589_c0_g1~~TRINITY_DN6589_c0_g1_i1.p1  ORF type:complete len:837 (+),score=151.29 TRINITY_DN6589_c0_g1_i1:54-2513(+)
MRGPEAEEETGNDPGDQKSSTEASEEEDDPETIARLLRRASLAAGDITAEDLSADDSSADSDTETEVCLTDLDDDGITEQEHDGQVGCDNALSKLPHRASSPERSAAYEAAPRSVSLAHSPIDSSPQEVEKPSRWRRRSVRAPDVADPSVEIATLGTQVAAFASNASSVNLGVPAANAVDGVDAAIASAGDTEGDALPGNEVPVGGDASLADADKPPRWRRRSVKTSASTDVSASADAQPVASSPFCPERGGSEGESVERATCVAELRPEMSRNAAAESVPGEANEVTPPLAAVAAMPSLGDAASPLSPDVASPVSPDLADPDADTEPSDTEDCAANNTVEQAASVEVPSLPVTEANGGDASALSVSSLNVSAIEAVAAAVSALAAAAEVSKSAAAAEPATKTPQKSAVDNDRASLEEKLRDVVRRKLEASRVENFREAKRLKTEQVELEAQLAALEDEVPPLLAAAKSSPLVEIFEPEPVLAAVAVAPPAEVADDAGTAVDDSTFDPTAALAALAAGLRAPVPQPLALQVPLQDVGALVPPMLEDAALPISGGSCHGNSSMFDDYESDDEGAKAADVAVTNGGEGVIIPKAPTFAKSASRHLTDGDSGPSPPVMSKAMSKSSGMSKAAAAAAAKMGMSKATAKASAKLAPPIAKVPAKSASVTVPPPTRPRAVKSSGATAVPQKRVSEDQPQEYFQKVGRPKMTMLSQMPSAPPAPPAPPPPPAPPALAAPALPPPPREAGDVGAAVLPWPDDADSNSGALAGCQGAWDGDGINAVSAHDGGVEDAPPSPSKAAEMLDVLTAMLQQSPSSEGEANLPL